MNVVNFLGGRAFDVYTVRLADGRWYVRVDHIGRYAGRHGVARSRSEASELAHLAMGELSVLVGRAT